MKNILGLDLGAASIGWAVIAEHQEGSEIKTEILGLGTRVIPYEGNEGRDFSKGSGESQNAERTRARTIRKGYDRYQLRRKFLVDTLIKNHMMPDEDLMHLPKMKLWELRSKSAVSEVPLTELGRVLLMLNQKRGYKSSRSDANLNKKDTEYVAAVKSRHDYLKESGLTIGQYFYNQLLRDEFCRIKDNVYPREAYIEEFDRICEVQMKFHKELTHNLVSLIRDRIVYYQRPLKSQKGLVSICDFEGFRVQKNGKEYFVGPKVTPKSSPLFQAGKIWENINNIKLSLCDGGEFTISAEQKGAIFIHLDNYDKLTATDLYKILGLKKDSCHPNKQLSKGLQGNVTKQTLKKCLAGRYEELLEFRFQINISEEERFLYSKKTGEVINSKLAKELDPVIEKEPLYQLWHTIYSINDVENCITSLQNRFGIDPETAGKLAEIDFSGQGFGNKSAKAIRKILPYLLEGDCYSDAMQYAGYDHSGSLTSEERMNRKTKDFLNLLPKNSLRQPVVEKILNQTINVVNAIIKKYGKPDEIRIELARELKQSREERNEADREMSKKQRENEEIALRLQEYGLRASRNNIIKWRLYHEMNGQERKMNAMCIYCGQPISLTEAIKGNEIDIEHIIPRSRLFDDSQSNKTLAHRNCNRDKGDLTAFDFMKCKPEHVFTDYVDRVNMLYSNHIISRSKRNKLLMAEDKIPDDFISRQLRESQYIAKKSREILQDICNNVWTTSGKVTAELRHIWGWDEVTMNLQIPKYREYGMTETKEFEDANGNSRQRKEVITGWSKRDDNRHHAIDALTIACTKQGFIQRFNTLNASETREEMISAINGSQEQFRGKFSLLEKYIKTQQPLSYKDVENATSGILVSFKAGKKVAVTGTRKTGRSGNRVIVQKGIIIPRGALSEESVYGRIKTLVAKKPLKYIFDQPNLIFNPYIKEVVEERLAKFDGDARKAIASLKKEPIYSDRNKENVLTCASCYKDEYVIKYKVDGNFNKAEKIIDKHVRQIIETRLNKFNGKPKEAFRDVIKEGKTITWYEDEGIKTPIRSVRCFTGLEVVVPVRKNSEGEVNGYVKPGNNHHIAIYVNNEGKQFEHICTFWHGVERKKYGLPVIIRDTENIWDKILQASEGTYPEEFLEKLPASGCRYLMSMQQNEMFILGLKPEVYTNALTSGDYKLISQYLYRVQKLTSCDYFFRFHLETQVIDSNAAYLSKRLRRVSSLPALSELNPIKVKIDLLGNIVTAHD